MTVRYQLGYRWDINFPILIIAFVLLIMSELIRRYASGGNDGSVLDIVYSVGQISVGWLVCYACVGGHHESLES